MFQIENLSVQFGNYQYKNIGKLQVSARVCEEVFSLEKKILELNREFIESFENRDFFSKQRFYFEAKVFEEEFFDTSRYHSSNKVIKIANNQSKL